MSATMMTSKLNGIDTDALKQVMADVKADPGKGLARFEVTTEWLGNGPKSRTRVDRWSLGGTEMRRNFTIDIDEPAELLGTNTAANPQEYLLAAMNACLLATFVAAASMQGITLERVEIASHGELDLRGFLGLDKSVKPGYDTLSYTIHVQGDGTNAQYEALHAWMKATSPNYFNMTQAIRMNSTLKIHPSTSAESC